MLNFEIQIWLQRKKRFLLKYRLTKNYQMCIEIATNETDIIYFTDNFGVSFTIYRSLNKIADVWSFKVGINV